MAKSSAGEIRRELAEYARRLKNELDSKKPRVYAAVVWAYQDSRVRDAIAARIEAGEVLTASAPIVPDRALRRERVYFDFSPRGRLDAKIPGMLVQIGDDNAVAEIINPFDPHVQSDVTIAGAGDTLPLFAARSAGDEASARAATAADPAAVRWTRFVQQPAMARAFAVGWGGAFGGLGHLFGETMDTLCGGVPTQSSVMSGVGNKEDPDQDTQGSYFDDSPL